MSSRSCLALGSVFLALASLSGCSGKDASMATVSGVITLNGSPVEGARVIFHPTTEVAGKEQTSYGALTDSSGKYVIAAINKQQPGIPPGMYKVTIVKMEGKGLAPQEGMDAGQLDAMVSDQGASAKGGPVNLLPKEYATVGSSKLSVTLEQGKNEGKDFDLKGKK